MKVRLALGTVVLALLTIAYRYLSFTDFSNDHFVHLSVAQQIMMGDLPVRDFVERGLPLMPLISAAGQGLFGEGLRSELWVIAIAYGIVAEDQEEMFPGSWIPYRDNASLPRQLTQLMGRYV